MKKFLINFVSTVFFIICFLILFSVNAHAYIDPSVMTYVIQIVAGGVIAIGTFFGIYFRRAKRKISNKLGMDEKKEVEDDEIIIKNKE